MATPDAGLAPESGTLSTGSYDTAICIIPPKQLWSVDQLRALYDKAYGKWPPHVNLIYPFVRIESLDKAARLLQSGLADWRSENDTTSLRVCLNSTDFFPHKHDNTIFRHDDDESRSAALKTLRAAIQTALGQEDAREFRMHMTVGQSADAKGDAHKFLLNKVGFLPDMEWQADQLAILIRERLPSHGTSQMKLWGTISLADGTLSRPDQPSSFYDVSKPLSPGKPISSGGDDQDENSDVDEDIDAEAEVEATVDSIQTCRPFYFDEELHLWQPYTDIAKDSEPAPKAIAVASYNVLAEFTWPPSQARYPIAVKNLLARRGAADVLVLQEVTDDFLCYLLRDEAVRETYPFVSHGPPDQADMVPLPSLTNLVVLSKWAFTWEAVSMKRAHKPSVVVKLRDIGRWEDDDFFPLVVATVHLTCGLTDGSVLSKKLELQRIVNFLKGKYPQSAWILAGDFNLSTSSFSIEAALKKKTISPQTAESLSELDRMLAAAGLVDAWTHCRHILGHASDDDSSFGAQDDGFEGEQGATFDPSANALAAEIVGSGLNNRPQRYDRILVRAEQVLQIVLFNKFGFLTGPPAAGTTEPSLASDHWGVRCVLRVGGDQLGQPSDEVDKLVEPVQLKKASAALADPSALQDALSELHVLPTKQEAAQRREAFSLLKETLTEAAPGETIDPAALDLLKASLVIVPVGSYGLGVWTSTSDIDVLVVGHSSSANFFGMATPRLRKAGARGVKILRRVDANSGLMLELEVHGVRMDLQYCPAAAMAEHWPEALRLPASDPAFSLPPQTLSKLKAARDLDYLRSMPDLPRFRTAFRTIKTWARARGVYAARFGYLGGIHLAVLLARVHKLLVRDCAYDGVAVSPPDLVTTFFAHYAAFDFAAHAVFDPFFHRAGPPPAYRRSAREPLAILGFHPPALNTAHAATRPSVRTLVREFQRADRRLSEGVDTTWTSFLGGGGAADFLAAHPAYLKLDAHYWALAPARGAAFLGWLESRVPALLVEVQRALPALQARVWPARFVAAAATASAASTAAEEEEEESREYQCCFLVGLDGLEALAVAERDVWRGALQTVAERFVGRVRADAKYFDGAVQYVGAGTVSRREVAGLRVDAREFGEWTPGDEAAEEEDGEEDVLEELSDEAGGPGAATAPRKKTGRGGKKVKAAVVVPKLEGGGRKLRTGEDVLNRLRWDPHLDRADYIVGYEDRFVGMRERALDQWKSEQTDDEFIPLHRVRYFKRRSDDVVIWDRDSRKDDLFGSGV